MTKRILFVDDDTDALQVLQDRMTAPVREWDFSFASTVGEAVNLFQRNDYDVVVTDNDIGGISGDEILKVAARRQPSAIRISLTDTDEPEAILANSSLAHRYIKKPYDPDGLLSALRGVFGLRDSMATPQITHLVNCIQTLPSMPSLYLDIMAELRSPSSSLVRVGHIVERDVAMTAKVLQLANSAYYAFDQRITDPCHAVSILGSNTITSLALTFGIFTRTAAHLGPLDINELMNHSTAVAYAARELAAMKSPGTPAADVAYLSGFLHDIGHLILADNFPTHYAEVDRLVREEGVPYLDAEHRMYGATHAEVGAYMLNLWGLPDPTVEAVLRHHTPGDSDDVGFSALTAVHVADSICGSLAVQTEGAAADPSYLSRIGMEIDEDSSAQILRRTLGVFEAA